MTDTERTTHPANNYMHTAHIAHTMRSVHNTHYSHIIHTAEWRIQQNGEFVLAQRTLKFYTCIH